MGAEANGGKEVSPTLPMEMDRHFFYFFILGFTFFIFLAKSNFKFLPC